MTPLQIAVSRFLAAFKLVVECPKATETKIDIVLGRHNRLQKQKRRIPRVLIRGFTIGVSTLLGLLLLLGFFWHDRLYVLSIQSFLSQYVAAGEVISTMTTALQTAYETHWRAARQSHSVSTTYQASAMSPTNDAVAQALQTTKVHGLLSD